MKKKSYPNVTLTCIMQQEDFTAGTCPHGVLSQDTRDGSFRFEEAVKKRRFLLNPKLFNGQYCSLVHMQNGRYQVHMKTIVADTGFDRNALANAVYSELLTALNIIEL